MTTRVTQPLDKATAMVESALRMASEHFDPSTRRVIGYHQGWLTPDGEPAQSQPGKGLRRTLALLSSCAAGAEPLAGLPAAVAVELVHSFSLLHDDVMDGDRLRRHRPAAWTVFGTSSAILAGDALLSAAFGALLESGHSSALAAARLLSDTMQSLVRGQSADLELERRSEVTVEECLAMIDGKTASLLGCACALGALLGGAPPDVIRELTGFGRQLGRVFQLTDDILGIWGDPAVTGKPAGSDLLRRKKSLPVVAALVSGRPGAAELAEHYVQLLPPTTELPYLVGLIEDCGGREYTEGRATDALQQAIYHLDSLHLPASLHWELLDFARQTTSRVF